MARELVTITCGSFQFILTDEPTQQQLVAFDKHKDMVLSVVSFPKDQWDEGQIIRVLYAYAEDAQADGRPEIVAAADWMRRVMQFRGNERVQLIADPISNDQEVATVIEDEE